MLRSLHLYSMLSITFLFLNGTAGLNVDAGDHRAGNGPVHKHIIKSLIHDCLTCLCEFKIVLLQI